MFVGHGLLAFAIAASVASAAGWNPRRATLVGLVALGFATLPDVDMAYPLMGTVLGLEGLLAGEFVLWELAAGTHRGVTHSLVVAAVVAAGLGLWHWRGVEHPLGLIGALVLVGVVAVAISFGGPLVGATTALFVGGGLALAWLATDRGLAPRHVAAVAALGLLSHPFGDLFTKPAPELAYPLANGIPGGYLHLHPDPTLHLLATFLLELAIIWAAVAVYASVHGWSLLPAIRPRAALGVGYAAGIFVIPTPSLDVPTPFVLSVLAVGALAVPWRRSRAIPARWQVPVTALAAVTAAGLAYTVAYLLVLG